GERARMKKRHAAHHVRNCTLGLITASALVGTVACSSTGESADHGDSASNATISQPNTDIESSVGDGATDSIDTSPAVVAFNSTPEEQDLPVLMAIDAMKEEGYNASI